MGIELGLSHGEVSVSLYLGSEEAQTVARALLDAAR